MKVRNESGQSTIEFILCFIFGVGLIVMVFNSSLNYVSGYVAHYATYMASRAYLTQSSNFSTFNEGNTSAIARNVATQVFQKYNLGIFGIDSSLGFNDAPVVDAGAYLMIGPYLKFEKKIDLMGQLTGQTKLELLSESYLGREPSRGICAQRVCRAITGGDSCDSGMDITLFDDGC